MIVWWIMYIVHLHVSYISHPEGTPLGYLPSATDSKPLDLGRTTLFLSMTSIPSRIGKLNPTINSLLRQDLFAPVLVYLPVKSRVEEKAFEPLCFLNNPPYVQIRWVDVDFGPATKYIPALLETSGLPHPPLILVVDDDVIYPPDFVRNFWEAHQRMPHAALCMRGWMVPKDLDWAHSPTVFGSEILAGPQRTGIITATHGYLLCANMTDVEALRGFTALSPEISFVDDVWISGHLSQQHVQKYIIPTQHSPFPNLLSLTTPDLGYRRRERNNVALAYFSNHWAADEYGM
jgi:hypothetical protein